MSIIFTEKDMSALYLGHRRIVSRAGFFVFVVLFGSIAYVIRPEAETVILRYNAFFGVDLLGAWWQIYLIPGICLAFFVGDLILSQFLFRRTFLMPALIFLYGAALIVLSGALATTALLFINT